MMFHRFDVEVTVVVESSHASSYEKKLSVMDTVNLLKQPQFKPFLIGKTAVSASSLTESVTVTLTLANIETDYSILAIDQALGRIKLAFGDNLRIS